MVKVSIEVRSGTARFNVAVQAQSIQRALGLIAGRYPKGKVRVTSPVDPEGSFVNDPAALAGMVGSERPQRMAA
jgi:hypothetical protein